MVNKIKQKNWKYKDRGDTFTIELLKKSINVSDIIAGLLVQKNIDTYDKAKIFLRPSKEYLNDPFLMKNMVIAIETINEIIKSNKKILIYGDYDVDGITSVALVYDFFNKIIPSKVLFYIPDRYDEGYGLSFKGIDYAKNNDCDLIIALDCGIRANEKVDYANSLFIDIIICDHHLPGSILPNAKAILDPKQSDCIYPFKELSGCGIGFKLIEAFSKKYLPSNIDDIFNYVDLVAISIASDIVPIVDENRILAFLGLKLLNEKPRTSIQAISRVSKLNKKINISDIVFMIGPRINAAGRVDHGKKAVNLLITQNIEIADEIANEINEDNTKRKGLDREISEEAIEIVNNDIKFFNKKSIIVYSDNWHKGVIGIVASRLVEKFYKPTIVLTKVDGVYTGSARSIEGFNINSALEKCSKYLEKFGGHEFAAGMTIKKENIELFADEFEKIAQEIITSDMLLPKIEIDLEINFCDINKKMLSVISQFEPFGPDNMSPVFSSNNVIAKENAKIVGENHIKLTLTQNGISFNAIAFNQGEFLEKIKNKVPFSVCYNIEENIWLNKSEIQLNIKDFKI